MATEITVEGAKELEAALNLLPAKVRAGILAEALAPAAQPVLRAAQAKAPRSPLPPDPPFDLLGSLEVRHGDKKPDHADVKIGSFGKGGPGEFAYQHGFVELGTVHAVPRPYLRPALDEQKEQVVATVAKWLRYLTENLLGGVARARPDA